MVAGSGGPNLVLKLQVAGPRGRPTLVLKKSRLLGRNCLVGMLN